MAELNDIENLTGLDQEHSNWRSIKDLVCSNSTQRESEIWKNVEFLATEGMLIMQKITRTPNQPGYKQCTCTVGILRCAII